ncbi:hypothetical protein HRbin30_02444 [bacterium HR30]|nr:hypothetical protein HRbin30_02444 [bacterium HR30]
MRTLMIVQTWLAAAVIIGGLPTAAGIFSSIGAAEAQSKVQRPPRPTPKARPTRVPRPTRPPGPRQTIVIPPTATPTPALPIGWGTPTPTPTSSPVVGAQDCPGVPVTCPRPPACPTGNKLGQLYYKYPVAAPVITTKPSEMRLHRRSNGIYPDTELGSFSLTDKDGVVVVQMPRLEFRRDGNGWLAETPDGWVRLAPKEVGPGYTFQVQFNNPPFPPGYFSVVYQMCFSVGDDGVDEQIVCQPKPRDGFLCHNNGPTF